MGKQRLDNSFNPFLNDKKSIDFGDRHEEGLVHERTDIKNTFGRIQTLMAYSDRISTGLGTGPGTGPI